MQDELPPVPIKPEDQITSEVQPNIEPNVTLELGDIAVADPELTMSSSIDSQNGSTISIDDLSSPEAIEKRVERALEKVDFEETPELREALRDYYESNYALASLLDTVMSEDPGSLTPDQKETRREQLQQEIDKLTEYGYQYDDILNEEHWASLRSSLNSGILPPAIGRIAGPLLAKVRQERLDDPTNEQLEIIEQLLLPVCAASLFNEASVCITSIDEDELMLITELDSRVATTLEESNHFNRNGQGSLTTILHTEVSGNTLAREIDPYSHGAASRESSEELFWKEIRRAGQLFFHNTAGIVPILSEGGIHTRRMQLLRNGMFQTGNADFGLRNGLLHAPTIHWSEKYSPDGYKSFKSREPGDIDSPGTIAMPIREIIETAPIGRDSEYGVLSVKTDRKEQVLSRIFDITEVSSLVSVGPGASDMHGTIGKDRTFYSSAIDVSWDTPLSQAPDGHIFPITENQYLLVINHREAEVITEAENQSNLEPTVVTIDQDLPASTIESIQMESVSRWPDDFVIPLRAGGVMTFSISDDMSLKGRQSQIFRVIPDDPLGSLRQ